MTLTYQFYSPVPVRQYCSSSNQREHQKLKNLTNRPHSDAAATRTSRKNVSTIRCVTAGKPIGSQVVHESPMKVHDVQQTKDLATVLAIGTANPTNVVYQEDFPDFYFRVTNSEHMTSFKEKFKRICEKTMIRKRHFLWNEEQLKENPALTGYMSPSFDIRNEIVAVEVPKLGYQAALKALSNWGQPKSMITHLIFSTSMGITMPGADFQLAKLLGLSPSVKRYMVYVQGCYAGGSALRLAKDIAENNEDARVLVVCSEVMTMFFRGPNENYTNALVGQSLFSDGAAATIIGDGKSVGDHGEKPLFQLVSTDQTIISNSENSITSAYSEAGLVIYLENDVPRMISKNIEGALKKTFEPIGMNNAWNNIFWMVHPGGRAILDMIERRLCLSKDKLDVSRHILSEYGNMMSPSILFVMEAMINKSREEGKATTGDGFDLGVLLAMGPGLTLETILIRSLPL